MKGRILLVMGLVTLLMAALAPTANAVSGYGPEECDSEGGDDPGVVDCEPDCESPDSDGKDPKTGEPCEPADCDSPDSDGKDPKTGEPCTKVDNGGVDRPDEEATPAAGGEQQPQKQKLAFTGSSTQTMTLLGAVLIGGGALVVAGTRRMAER